MLTHASYTYDCQDRDDCNTEDKENQWHAFKSTESRLACCPHLPALLTLSGIIRPIYIWDILLRVYLSCNGPSVSSRRVGCPVNMKPGQGRSHDIWRFIASVRLQQPADVLR